ncbi:MAG: diacylglycerol kinase family lipid kinase [Burkholderiales bacterium]|jgi:YegS/Rv2252/BmrU family lipid kinase|nr:diacylglycerol kinase family lipid kinase [Burkholderiales bacterium]
MSAWLAIVNPAAGGGRSAQAVPALQAAMARARLSLAIRISERRGHATELARDAAAAGYCRFLAVGGDGTVNEVANGLLGNGRVAPSALTLGVLPIGTGNDWARTHAIPKRPEDVVALVASGKTVLHDVGVATCRSGDETLRRHFVNMAGVGIDAHILDRLGDGKGGTWSYLAALLGGLRSYRTPTLRVEGPDFRFHGPTLVVFAGPGRYCGGGLEIAPDATVDDGCLRVTVVKQMALWQVLANLPRLFNGTVPQSPHVVAARSPALDIASDVPVGVEVDGEVIGAAPVRFEILPRAIRVVSAR